ncbi:hypothetical protein Droror1_Dr00025460 [Drosera rotundifolia]
MVAGRLWGREEGKRRGEGEWREGRGGEGEQTAVAGGFGRQRVAAGDDGGGWQRGGWGIEVGEKRGRCGRLEGRREGIREGMGYT